MNGFRDWCEERYARETVRQLVCWINTLDRLGVLDWDENDFEDYVWRYIRSIYSRRGARNAYRKYWEWRSHNGN